jgi:hypothetical protein
VGADGGSRAKCNGGVRPGLYLLREGNKNLFFTSFIYYQSLYLVIHVQNRIFKVPQLTNPVVVFFFLQLFWRVVSHDVATNGYIRSLNY